MGGYITDGLALYDHLQELKLRGHHLTTIGLGAVASMGPVLLQAGSHRVLGANAFLMLHEASAGTGRKVWEMKRICRALQARLFFCWS